MLAFLEMLCNALLTGDRVLVRRLLAHPLAEALPRRVQDEARVLVSAANSNVAVPLQTMLLYHQTAHLLGVSSEPTRPTGARPSAVDRAPVVAQQIELLPEHVAA